MENNRAVSYTISAIIITATTISLVLVASIYAYQVLEQQRGATEFDVTRESILAFNDALENIAWKPGAVSSSRFTIEYGYLQLVPNGNNIIIEATVDGTTTTTLYSNTTGFMRYYLSNKYISFGQGYHSYILGNSSTLIVGSTDSYGRAVINQTTGWVTITLDYRVRAMKTSVVQVDNVTVNYVDIWVIRFTTLVSQSWSYVHDFDLKARCLDIQTITKGPYDVPPNGNAAISVQIGSEISPTKNIPLEAGEVVFNVIVAEVQVSV
ncbi:MAG: hypothetical protein ACE5OV_02660 [Candidatus Bathyarchaeia archaeon]